MNFQTAISLKHSSSALWNFHCFSFKRLCCGFQETLIVKVSILIRWFVSGWSRIDDVFLTFKIPECCQQFFSVTHTHTQFPTSSLNRNAKPFSYLKIKKELHNQLVRSSTNSCLDLFTVSK